MTEPKYETVSVPMLDTGIGREAGFESDKALHDAVEAEIAALSVLTRLILGCLVRSVS